MRKFMFLLAASAAVALSTGVVAARAAEGGHGEHGGPGAGGEAVHPAPSTAPHVEAHDNHGKHVPPSVTPHEGDVSIFGGKEHREDGWRYRYENGEWWYWLPSGRWSYYYNNSWQDYAVDNAAPAAPVASDPNYYWYNNQWWYWLGGHWQYYDKGHWQAGAAGMGPPRRGPDHGLTEKHEPSPHVGIPAGPKK